MSTLSSSTLVNPQDIFVASTSAQTSIGALAHTGDGRSYRYVASGASALVAGTLLQGPARIANHLQLTPVAAAVGATSVTVALGATAATANYYAGGLLVVSADAGTGGLLGFAYGISSHPAAALSANLTLTLSDPLLNLISTSAKIDLVPNQYNGVVIYPTTGVGAASGVATYAMPLANYGWVQVAGNASVLNDAGGSITVGNAVVPSTSVAGAVKSATGTLPIVGVASSAGTASQNFTVKLQGIL